MRRMTTSTHGIIDYTFGLAVGILPFVLRMSPRSRAMLETAAASATAYSSVTDYERGIARVFPMKLHLALDAVSGITFLAAAATMKTEKPGTRALLAGIGLSEVFAALLTETKPRHPARGREDVASKLRKSFRSVSVLR